MSLYLAKPSDHDLIISKTRMKNFHKEWSMTKRASMKISLVNIIKERQKQGHLLDKDSVAHSVSLSYIIINYITS